MKKNLALLLFLLASIALSAQKAEYYKDKRHEVRLSVGSISDDYYHYDNYIGSGGGYWYSWGYYSGGYYYPSDATSLDRYLQGGVKPGNKTSAGAYSLSYQYHAPWINGRFTLGAALSYSRITRDYKDRFEGSKIGDSKEYNIGITPTIRYSWIAKSMFQFYSGIGVSLNYNNYKLDVKKQSQTYLAGKDDKFEASFMITPIGFSVGRDIFAFGEVNVGGRMGIFTGGIGYRF